MRRGSASNTSLHTAAAAAAAAAAEDIVQTGALYMICCLAGAAGCDVAAPQTQACTHAARNSSRQQQQCWFHGSQQQLAAGRIESGVQEHKQLLCSLGCRNFPLGKRHQADTAAGITAAAERESVVAFPQRLGTIHG
jgi:hypothetical protein